jgi:hypothetical protein
MIRWQYCRGENCLVFLEALRFSPRQYCQRIIP